jgi:hypothetical protein
LHRTDRPRSDVMGLCFMVSDGTRTLRPIAGVGDSGFG